MTLSHQLQDSIVTDLSSTLWTLSIQSQNIQNIFWVHLWHPYFSLRSVRSSLPGRDASACERQSACVYMCMSSGYHSLHSVRWKHKKWHEERKKKKKKENGAATSTVVAWVIWSIPCNYWDLCSSTFQGEFVSKPPVEIWSVFNSFNARRGGWEWAGGRWAVSSQFSLHLTTQHSHFALCQPECISKITYHYCLIDRVEPSSACIRFDWYLKPVIWSGTEVLWFKRGRNLFDVPGTF